MTKLLRLVVVVVVFPYSVYAELTKQDLQEIQAMFDKQERIFKEHIDTKLEAVDAKIAAVDAKIEAVKESVGTLQWAVGIIGVLVVAILGAPQWITLAKERREARWYDLLNTRLEEMRRELEVLKRPS